jgi:asparagine synthase (glutamine-hydrolysing)
MCGICGSANSNGEIPKKLDESVELLAYRGPDDEGIYSGKHCSLGHTRLAIQDAANAKQPMASHSGRHILVFNGEIYNHFDLRALIPYHAWRTESDT